MKIIKIKSCLDCPYSKIIDFDTFRCTNPNYPYPNIEYSMRAFECGFLGDCPLEEWEKRFKEDTEMDLME